jgi:Holliday junction resolvase RusA-like endonuclease
VRETVQQYMEEEGLAEFGKDRPLYLSAVFYLPKPKSTKREWPTVRPDLSNFFKSLEDGLQREKKDSDPALMEDDSAICSISCEKRYVNEEYPEPGILVEIGEFHG